MEEMKKKDQELLKQMRVELLKRSKEMEDGGKKEKSKWKKWMMRYGE